MTSYAPVYRLVVYQARSTDPNEAIALTPVASAPHADSFKVTTGPAAAGPTKPTAAMLSHAGMTVFTAANCVDGNLTNTGWGTDSAVSGATLQVDLGAGVARKYQICRIYVLAGTYAGLYDVEYSDNGSSWTKAVTGFKPTVGDNWHSCTWQDAGAHRYWRALLTNTPGAGPEIAELELWEVDGPGDWKPYLKHPESGRRGKVDVRNKSSDTGVMTFELWDPELPGADPLARFLPAFLGDLKGQLRAGGLLARAFESLDGGGTWTPFWAGRVRTVRQVEPIRYALGVRELTDDLQARAWVGRPHGSITYAGVPTLLPVGAATVPYGLLPVVRPLTGKISSLNFVQLDAASVNRRDNLITENIWEATPPSGYTPTPEGLTGNPPDFFGTARVRLKRLDTQAVGYFRVAYPTERPDGRGHVRAAGLLLQALDPAEVGFLALPPNNTQVEVWMDVDTMATKETPIVVGDVPLVTLLKHLLEGKFGFLWTPPETKPPGVNYGDPKLPMPYHAAKVAALEADTRLPLVRFVVTKREPRARMLQVLCRIGNLAYYFDGAGVFHPVDLRTPTDVSSVPTITDAELESGAPKEWAYDRGQAITRVDAAHYTDQLGTVEDLNADGAAYPRMKGGMLTEVRHSVHILDLGSSDLGDAPFELDAIGFRSMVGEPLNGQARKDYYERRLIDLAVETARPFGVGAPTLPLSVKRGGAGDALPGEVRKISIRSVPDPATHKLGGTRLVRIVERQDHKAFIALVVMDLGLPTVAGVPTLGVPAQEGGNTAFGVSVSVTVNAAADPVEVHYAVTPTSEGSAPATGSALWTSIPQGLIRATGTVTFRAGTPAQRVWVRGRSFPDARVNYQLPSAWVAAASPGRVDLASLAAPTSPAGSLQTARSFRVTWTVGGNELPTEVLLATPTTDPRVVVARLPAGSALYDFPGDTGVLLQPSTTYRVGIRHSTGPEAVSAEVTVDVTTTAVEPTLPPISIQPRIFGKIV